MHGLAADGSGLGLSQGEGKPVEGGMPGTYGFEHREKEAVRTERAGATHNQARFAGEAMQLAFDIIKSGKSLTAWSMVFEHVQLAGLPAMASIIYASC
jgi:hypothetical protein